MAQQEQLDVISIGDIVTDVFIKLNDQQAFTYKDEKGQWLAMPFGTKIPFDSAEIVPGVGNVANAAVAFAKLGLHSAIYTNIGDDQAGTEMVNAMHQANVDSRFIRRNPHMVSNIHYVLRYQVERTILIKHEAYKYHWPYLRAADIPSWIYLTSVSQHYADFHDQLADWLDSQPNVKLAFQPGTYQLEAGPEKLKRIYARTEVLMLNREEATLLSGGNHEDYYDLLGRLHALGPKIVVITDGPNGAVASDNHQAYSMPLYPDVATPVDRTGAGDAFSATFIAALIKGNTIQGALQWAPINSMTVLQKVGAQAGLLTEAELDKYLAKAPEYYVPTAL